MALLIANTTSEMASFTLKVGHISSSFYILLTIAVSWACFKIKNVNSPSNYEWQQPCIYMQWDYETDRQLVFIFSFRNTWASSFIDHIPDHEKRRTNPFSWHYAFAREILKSYNSAYWKLRDIVRNEEKAWPPRGILLFNPSLTPPRSGPRLKYWIKPIFVSCTIFLDISFIGRRQSRLPRTLFKVFLRHKSVGGRKARKKSRGFYPLG